MNILGLSTHMWLASLSTPCSICCPTKMNRKSCGFPEEHTLPGLLAQEHKRVKIGLLRCKDEICHQNINRSWNRKEGAVIRFLEIGSYLGEEGTKEIH